jgi:mycothiol synthase
MTTNQLDRRPMRPADVAAWAALLASIRQVDHTWEYFTEADLLEDFDNPYRDFDHGYVAVFDGDAMVGYGGLLWRSAADPIHDMRYEGGVHPTYRGRGIGNRLLEWAEPAAVGIHNDHHPGHSLSLSGSCAADDVSAIALFESRGYEQVRWFHGMVRNLSQPVPKVSTPEGVEIVGWSPELSEDARLVRNEAFRDHFGSTDATPAGWEYFLATAALRPELSFVAYSEGDPAGFIIGHEYEGDPYATGRDVYISIVGTRRAYRGRGIASALLTRVIGEAKASEFATASLDVDSDSQTGAVGLYRRLGFLVEHRSVRLTKRLL